MKELTKKKIEAKNDISRLLGLCLNSASNVEKWKAAEEGREFLSLGEPVKIGHHMQIRGLLDD